jgi:hypothetical protein
MALLQCHPCFMDEFNDSPDPVHSMVSSKHNICLIILLDERKISGINFKHQAVQDGLIVFLQKSLGIINDN